MYKLSAESNERETLLKVNKCAIPEVETKHRRIDNGMCGVNIKGVLRVEDLGLTHNHVKP